MADWRNSICHVCLYGYNISSAFSVIRKGDFYGLIVHNPNQIFLSCSNKLDTFSFFGDKARFFNCLI